MQITLSEAMKAVASVESDGITKKYLEDTAEQVASLERRLERVEGRHRNTRVKYNAAIKALRLIHTMSNEVNLDPYRPDFDQSDNED